MSQSPNLNERLQAQATRPGNGAPPPGVAAPAQAAKERANATQNLINKMAAARCIDPGKFLDVILRTVMPENATMEHVAALLLVADKYGLDPLVKEVCAFKTKGGGVAIQVSIDGWCKIVNRQPTCDGWDFEDKLDDNGKMISCTVKFYRKDRSHPSCVTEYMDECIGQTVSQSGATMPWGKWGKRLLRHKTFSQGARYTFSISDILDPDEIDRYHEQGLIEAGPMNLPVGIPEAEPLALADSNGGVTLDVAFVSSPVYQPVPVQVEAPAAPVQAEAIPIPPPPDQAPMREPGDDSYELVPLAPGEKARPAIPPKADPDPTWAERHGQPASFGKSKGRR